MSSTVHKFRGPWAAGVYAIRNLNDGKVYVGGSLCISSRASHHIWHLRRSRHVNERLQSAWAADGEGCFIFKVLELINDTSLLHEREQYYLDKLGSANPALGYNISPTAELVTHPEATRVKLRQARATRVTSDETRSAISNYAKNRPVGHHAKVTAHLRSKSPEHLAKIGAAHRNKVISEAQRLKQSIATKGRKQTPDHIANRTAARMANLAAARSRA
jgi:group I intron endonuclease